jgi:hypothetical protein
MARKATRRTDASKWSRIALAVRENAPTIAVAGIAFSGSYRHITRLSNEHGQHGYNATAVAVCVDLLCTLGAEERQRDKRVGRTRPRGWVTWPTLVLALGISLTLAANLATADPGMWGHIIAAIPSVAMLVALSLLERRASHSAPTASSGADVTRTRARKPQPTKGLPTASGADHHTAPIPPSGPIATERSDDTDTDTANNDDGDDSDQLGDPPAMYSHEQMLAIARAMNDESLATRGRPVAVLTLRAAIGRRKEVARALLDELAARDAREAREARDAHDADNPENADRQDKETAS